MHPYHLARFSSRVRASMYDLHHEGSPFTVSDAQLFEYGLSRVDSRLPTGDQHPAIVGENGGVRRLEASSDGESAT